MRKWRLLVSFFVSALAFNCPPLLAQASEPQVNTIHDLMARLRSCWQAPPASETNPITITIVVSFTRSGEILGHPRVTYELAEATDKDRLEYRIAAMNALQHCTPIPFTDAMGGAIAGRPLRLMMGSKPALTPPQKRA